MANAELARLGGPSRFANASGYRQHVTCIQTGPSSDLSNQAHAAELGAAPVSGIPWSRPT